MTTKSNDDAAKDSKAKTSQKKTDDVIKAVYPGSEDDRLVTVTLSNPLQARYFATLGLPYFEGEEGDDDMPPLDQRQDMEVGQKVAVSTNAASSIIGAGYATIDPEDTTAVAATLRGEEAPESGLGAPGTGSTDGASLAVSAT